MVVPNIIRIFEYKQLTITIKTLNKMENLNTNKMVKLTLNETIYEFKELNRIEKTYFNGTTLIETDGVVLKNGKEVLPFECSWEKDNDDAFYHFECGDDTFSMNGKKEFPLEISLKIILKYLDISK